jgi:SPP1 family phage portal protein
MRLWKTDKTTLTPDEIEEYIETHQDGVVPHLDELWAYYLGKNPGILNRPKGDPNNPDNRTPVSYGRKIVTTFTGYAYRPKYITYKADDEAIQGYMDQLQMTFDLSDEHIKTSRAGRNTAIFGAAFELMYIDGMQGTTLPTVAEPRFVTLDPREIILLYDYSPEPKKVVGIRYYRIHDKLYKVEVYYPDRVELYDRVRSEQSAGIGVEEWRLISTGEAPNYFDEVPVVPYYFGDDRVGLIEPVLPLIDDYDVIISDSINEFERFAHAYMLLVRMNLVDPNLKKEPGAFSQALKRLRSLRIFENLPDRDAVSFLTKDIPKDFIEWMTTTLREQIHTQSHVPDFASQRLGELSGAAVDRLMFDFENVVSSAEADFDTGLLERIRLINRIYEKTGRIVDEIHSIVINHKRNMPLNLDEFASTAEKMKRAGFSRYLLADIMPDDIIPNVDEELARQDEDMEAIMPDIDAIAREEEEVNNAVPE